MAHDVFLSYSRKDIKTLRRVRDSLTNAGLIVWTDEKLQPGTPSWKDAIEEALEHSKTVVVLMSPDAKKSVWVDRELEYANKRSIPIYPILVRGDERSAIPFELASTQYVDIRRRFIKGMRPLVSRLCQHLGIRDTSSRISRPATISLRPIIVKGRNVFARRIVRTASLVLALLLISLTTLLILQASSNDGIFVHAESDSLSDSAGSPLVLIYDGVSLTLHNQTNTIIDTSGLDFVYSAEDTSQPLFSSDEWVNDGTLSPTQCVQVWGLDSSYPNPPENCESRRAWRQIAPTRVFWQTELGRTNFQVRRGNAVIAICDTVASNSLDEIVCSLGIEY